MFSVVYGVLHRPLPYADQDRLVEVVHEVPTLGIGQFYASPAICFGYRDHNRTFDAIGHWDWDNSPVTVSGNGEPESVTSLEVTHEVLPDSRRQTSRMTTRSVVSADPAALELLQRHRS